jgi:hypothetical protein
MSDNPNENEFDDVLWKCTNTELVQIARRQGLPPLRIDTPKAELVAVVGGYKDYDPATVAGTQYTRGLLEQFLRANWGKVRSQLPGCDGKCTTYPCSEGRHAMCFAPNVELMQFTPK